MAFQGNGMKTPFGHASALSARMDRGGDRLVIRWLNPATNREVERGVIDFGPEWVMLTDATGLSKWHLWVDLAPFSLSVERRDRPSATLNQPHLFYVSYVSRVDGEIEDLSLMIVAENVNRALDHWCAWLGDVSPVITYIGGSPPVTGRFVSVYLVKPDLAEPGPVQWENMPVTYAGLSGEDN